MKLSSITTICALTAFTTLLLAQTTPAPQTPDKTPAVSEAPPMAECPMGMHGGKGMQDGKGMQRGKGMHRGTGGQRGMGMQGKGMGRGRVKRTQDGMVGNMADHTTIHSLMMDHASVKRTTTDLPNGVRTETTSEDPAVATTIRTHVRQMYTRLEKGQPIRMFDPLFQEVFANADKIEMKVDDIPGGVRVTETSKDSNVVLLIRQHARALDGFVAEGMAKMHVPSPLPEGYKPSK